MVTQIAYRQRMRRSGTQFESHFRSGIDHYRNGRERYMDPTDIAAGILQKDRAAFSPPERLKDGLTNQSWLLREAATAGAWVVRLSNTREDELQIDRHSEAAVLAAVAIADLGPQIVRCLPEQHLLVTEYLQGNVWTPRAARQPENIERIVALLKRLHALPIPTGVRTTNLRAVVSGYWNTLMARGLSAQTGSPEQRERARQIMSEMEAEPLACLCHNDIHHLNVIDDGQLRLIDWEYAGIGDPYFDLASICCYHAYSDPLRSQLLRLYLGSDRPAALERLHRMCWLFDYIRELWFAVREMR
jgi:thiamine kinase